MNLHTSDKRLVSVVFNCLLVCFAICAYAMSGSAQQPPENAESLNTAISSSRIDGSNSKSSSNEYFIGPGDELSIQVFGRAQLSRDQRVDMRGMIRMPLIEEDIRAACRTESELAEEIARIYREHQLLKNPSVSVSVKDYQSQPVAVLGSVNSPGRFILRRRVRLLELLVFHAGGPNAAAGRKVRVLSMVPVAPCEASTVQTNENSADSKPEGSLVIYDLTDLLSGKESSNPYVHQGDIIDIPAAQQAYIVGNVLKPSPVPVVGPTTLSHALATVGGILPNSKKDKIRITREIPGSTATAEIFVDLAAVDKSKGENFLLQGGDIVEVGTKGGFLRALGKSVIPTLTGLPIRVIP